MNNITFEKVMLGFLKKQYREMDESVATYRNLVDVEGPKLRESYIDQIADKENEVLNMELETEMLRRKSELVAAALNRRETPDLDAIENQVESEFEEKLAEMTAEESVSIEALENWKKNPDIEEMIGKASDIPELSEEVFEYSINRINGFEVTAIEEMLATEIQRIQDCTDGLEEAVAALGNSFPFCAAATLSDPDKIQEYLDSLETRKRQAETDMKKYKEKIDNLLSKKGEK